MASEDDGGSNSADEFEYEGGKSGTIFLIDSRTPMFSKDFTDSENKLKTRFNIAIQCCRTALMNKIIAKQNDLIGIVLFGTDKPDPDKTKYKHVTLLLELNYPSAEAVKKLDKLIYDENSIELQRTYGSSNEFLLADALWFCSSLFSNSGVKLEEKQIVMFTDDSDPHVDHADRAHMARKRAKDVNQVGISLELLPMGIDFDYSKFYKELVETVNGSTDSEAVDPFSKLEHLLERVNRLDYKRRRYSKIKWNLGNGISVGVSLYTLFKQSTVMPKEPLYRATNKPVKRVRQTFDVATGELLLSSDVVQYMNIAGSDIAFSSEEKQKLTKIMEPGITLLGFKPLSFVSESLHCGSPSFAYPEETLIKGSKGIMKALVDRCIAKEKVALCCITPRNRAVTKYVCLVPSQETYDNHGNQLTPCGFHVIPLPFNNDTREQTLPVSPDVEDETIEIAKRLIYKLKLSYKASTFNNPKLQQYWKHLEALALDYPVPEEIEDLTVPDVETQSQRLGVLADDFKNACSLEGPQGTAKKRPLPASSSSSAKKVKETLSESELAKNMKEAIANKKVEKFTVPQLKDFLTSHNQDVKGMKKADLVEAVYKLKM